MIKEIIEHYKSIVVQIASPFAIGTGFYLEEYELIITNEHVVRNNKEVVVEIPHKVKAVMPVIYMDPRLDIAFVKPPKLDDMTSICLSNSELVEEGDVVIAVGHPFGLKYTATQGIVSNTSHLQHDILYIQHDAALNPGNSGGPLINSNNEIIGINTFIFQNGQNLGFSLPSNYIMQSISLFLQGNGKPGVNCESCANIVYQPNPEAPHCPHCGASISMISDIKEYEPTGIKAKIEALLIEMGYNIRLSRRGMYMWQIQEGSAIIYISYHPDTGQIIGEAILTSLPKEKIKEIYIYLLQQNYKMMGLSFSIRENDILLSTLIFDQYFEAESAYKIFKNLIEVANNQDDILIESFGALKRLN